MRSRSWASQKGDSTGRGYKFPHSALCLVHKIHWNFSALLHVPAKVYVHDCFYLGLTSMWTIFQLFWRHCFQICGSFTQHWDECHPKPCSRWNIYNSSTHVKFKYRDCPSCTTFLLQDSSYYPVNQFSKSGQFAALHRCTMLQIVFHQTQIKGGMYISVNMLYQTVQILVTYFNIKDILRETVI